VQNAHQSTKLCNHKFFASTRAPKIGLLTKFTFRINYLHFALQSRLDWTHQAGEYHQDHANSGIIISGWRCQQSQYCHCIILADPWRPSQRMRTLGNSSDKLQYNVQLGDLCRSGWRILFNSNPPRAGNSPYNARSVTIEQAILSGISRSHARSAKWDVFPALRLNGSAPPHALPSIPLISSSHRKRHYSCTYWVLERWPLGATFRAHLTHFCDPTLPKNSHISCNNSFFRASHD